jgi:hypothetical protein
MAGAQKRESCRKLFKKFHTLPLASKHLLSLVTFISDDLKMFQTKSDIHTDSMRCKNDLHR